MSNFLTGLEISAKWNKILIEISLSTSLGLKSQEETLDLNFAYSAKCLDMSVSRMQSIIIFLNFLNSSLLKLVVNSYFSCFSKLKLLAT